MSVKVAIHAAIKSPTETVTVGPDRKITVTVEAWCVVRKQGGGNGGNVGGGGKDPVIPNPSDPHRPQPLGDDPSGPGKDIEILSEKKFDAGKVEVDLGKGFRNARQLSPNKWQYTGKVTPEEVEIKSKVHPGKGFSAKPKIVSREIDVKLFDDHEEPEIKNATLKKVSLGPPYVAKITGKAEDQSFVKSVKWHLETESGDTKRKSGNWWEAEVPLPDREQAHTITISAEDKYGNESKNAAQITVPPDKEPPALEMTFPGQNPHKVFFVEGGITVPVMGTTQPVNSKIKTVKWSQDGGPVKEAENVKGDWSEWRFMAKIDRPVSHKIAIWVRDVAGNGGRKDEPNQVLEVHPLVSD